MFNKTSPTSKLASSVFVHQWNYRKWEENYTCHITDYKFNTEELREKCRQSSTHTILMDVFEEDGKGRKIPSVGKP